MSQTAERFTLLDQEYVEFIQALMSKTVAEPIAGLRGSAAEALAAPAGDLVRAKDDLAKVAKDLDERLSARVARAVDSLQAALEGLEEIGEGIDKLRAERSEKIGASLAELRTAVLADRGRLQEELRRTGEERLAAERQWSERLAHLSTGLEHVDAGMKDLVRSTEETLGQRFAAEAEQRVRDLTQLAERLTGLKSGLDQTAQRLTDRLQSLDASASQQSRSLQEKLSALQKQLEQRSNEATSSILAELADAKKLGQTSRQELGGFLGQIGTRLDILARQLVHNAQQLETQSKDADRRQHELQAKLQQMLAAEQVRGNELAARLQGLERSQVQARRFLIALTVLCGVALLTLLLHVA